MTIYHGLIYIGISLIILGYLISRRKEYQLEKQVFDLEYILYKTKEYECNLSPLNSWGYIYPKTITQKSGSIPKFDYKSNFELLNILIFITLPYIWPGILSGGVFLILMDKENLADVKKLVNRHLSHSKRIQRQKLKLDARILELQSRILLKKKFMAETSLKQQLELV